ncbi:MAG: hypothetical protein NTX04_12585 [Verrucomicrobia bacterium]|nr:hypothetical protein [Verrucomicrobiota bacterium]
MKTRSEKWASVGGLWIPDISVVAPRKQATIGLMVSVGVHLLAFLVVGLSAGLLPERLKFPKPKPPAAELELVILPREEPKILAAPVPEEKPTIDSRGLAESKKPTESVFESDKDMTAASEKAATGDVPLPIQEGRGKVDKVFSTQKGTVGVVKEEMVPVLAVVSPPAPPAPPVSSPPSPKVEMKVETKVEPVKAEVEKVPLEKERLSHAELALKAKPATELPGTITRLDPVRTKVPVERIVPEVTLPVQLAKLTPPSVAHLEPRAPTYQPEQEKSRVEGMITNRGKNAVSATATPLGKYKSQVYSAIGSRWLYYVKDRMEVLSIGTAKLSFFVTREGRIQGIHVDGNTANASFAEVCERAIREAEISKPPPGSLDQVREGRLEYAITFTLYNFRE